MVLVNSKKDGELDISHIMTKVSRNYVKDIQSGVADAKEILDLAIRLLRKSRTYYKL